MALLESRVSEFVMLRVLPLRPRVFGLIGFPLSGGWVDWEDVPVLMAESSREADFLSRVLISGAVRMGSGRFNGMFW